MVMVMVMVMVISPNPLDFPYTLMCTPSTPV